MTPAEFEALLSRAAQFLTVNLRSSTLYHGPERFEQGVLAALQNAAADLAVTVEPTYHRHAFPDIRVNGFGVEVKYSKHDTWNAVGNSVFESMRDPLSARSTSYLARSAANQRRGGRATRTA